MNWSARGLEVGGVAGCGVLGWPVLGGLVSGVMVWWAGWRHDGLMGQLEDG